MTNKIQRKATDLGRHIAYQRRRNCMTQKDLAAQIGMPRQTLCEWEKGNNSAQAVRVLEVLVAVNSPLIHNTELEALSDPAENKGLSEPVQNTGR